MSGTALNFQEQIARIDRSIAETEKLMADRRKLLAERSKCNQEELKLSQEALKARCRGAQAHLGPLAGAGLGNHGDHRRPAWCRDHRASDWEMRAYRKRNPAIISNRTQRKMEPQ